ncbi:MAG: metallophosphoesterase [Bacteroidia bacterium]|nr:metallophosphoesterase [Bacteroidia bacterium]
MRPFFPVIFTTITIALLSLIEIFLLRALHRDWWAHLWVRRLSWGVPVAGSISVLVWTLGILSGVELIVAVGATAAAAIFVLGVALMLSLPFSGLLHVADRVRHWVTHKRMKEEPVLAGRRRLLTTTAAVFPALAISAGAKGLANGYLPPRFPVVPLPYPSLPLELEGLRILHISDVHIGFFIGLEDLEDMARDAAAMKPDLVLITGDFSDEAATYLDALRIAAQIPSTYGSYATLGNHEYFRGIQEILRAYERGPIPLLFNSGTELTVGNARLHIAGIDDPKSMRRMPAQFFERSIDAALRDAGDGAFRVLMTHRPMAFDAAAKRGVELTLAGHTHGGQIGFNGRSVLYALNPEKYMWGLYEKDGAKLFVSAGAGHWFPYRIGCPAEIPLYVLTSAKPV